MKKSYFRLYANCIITVGFANSLIIDLQRNMIYKIDSNAAVILKRLNNKSIKIVKLEKNEHWDYIEEMMNKLVSMNIGFFTNTPERFPPLDLSWNYPGHITNAIIDINKNHSLKYLIDIINQLENLLCKYVQIRSFNKVNFNMTGFISDLNKSGSYIQGVSFVLPYSKKLQDDSIKHQRIKELILYGAPKDKLIVNKSKYSWIRLIKGNLQNSINCGTIYESEFTPNIYTFTEAQHYNTCLNRKISIDADGNIKNCPSMKEYFGNIRNTTLAEALEKPGFKKYWNIKKDDITKCKDCEFRYICTDCRAYLEDPDDIYSAPLKCGYDPYTGKWEKWSENPLMSSQVCCVV